MAVSEGFDVGAICSLIVAAFVVFQTIVQPGPRAVKIVKGLIRVALVAFCAGLMAAQTLSTIIGTQVQGIAGTQQDIRPKNSSGIGPLNGACRKSKLYAY